MDNNMAMMNFWSLMGMLAVLQNFINHPLLARLWRLVESWKEEKNPHHFFRVPKMEDEYHKNEMYTIATTYIATLNALADTDYANVYVHRHGDGKDRKRLLSLENEQSIEDEFKGVKVWWTHYKSAPQRGGKGEHSAENHTSGRDDSSFVVKMLKKDKELVLGDYLDHVAAVAEEVERKRMQVMLYSNRGGGWLPVPFRHPSTFDTIALDAELKSSIKSDLDAFLKRKSYYHIIGRCWKRGYLFYGPPGTGKSSMVAAMANYLHFDVYDLELSHVFDNYALRNLVLNTKNKSILVIEDIDCSLDSVKKRTDEEGDPHGDDGDEFSCDDAEGVGMSVRMERRFREKICNEKPNGARAVGLTLSGILNCMDGLWSCCGEERIFVFTTNNKDKLDSALLRPGRMDFHVYFPHCSFDAFKILARNYLCIDDHDMYPLLHEAFGVRPGALTPAEVAETFLKHQSEGPHVALSSVLYALRDTSPKKCSN